MLASLPITDLAALIPIPANYLAASDNRHRRLEYQAYPGPTADPYIAADIYLICHLSLSGAIGLMGA